jgi:heat shock protein HslJ
VRAAPAEEFQRADDDRQPALSNGRPRDAQSIAGTRWRVLEINGEVAPPSAGPEAQPAATLLFTHDGMIAGSSACNNFGGAVRWTSDGSFKNLDMPLIMTLMGCGQDQQQRAVVAFGDRFLRLMQHAMSWDREGAEVVIRSLDGSTARLAPLE